LSLKDIKLKILGRCTITLEKAGWPILSFKKKIKRTARLVSNKPTNTILNREITNIGNRALR